MPAPLLQLAAIAERTTRLRLGIAVNLLPLHHPLRIAEELASEGLRAARDAAAVAHAEAALWRARADAG